jgi:hypothetical protein
MAARAEVPTRENDKEVLVRNAVALALALLSVTGMVLAQPEPAISPNPNTQNESVANPPRIPEAAAANPQTDTAHTGSATAGTAVSNTDQGLKTATSASVGVRFVEVQPANVMSSNLIGTNVYNNQNESLGAIRDLVIDNGNKITGIVVNVSGFLGLAESYVVVDPSTIVLTQKDGVWRAYVDTSRDNLKSAPKFTYAKKNG